MIISSFLTMNVCGALTLEETLKSVDKTGSSLSIYVEKISDNQTLLSINAHTLMLPASTLKLLTAVAVTSAVGNDYRYTTKLTSKGEIQNGTLQGDLYVEFSGDPSLRTMDLHNLFSTMREKGLKRVNGQIIAVGKDVEDGYAKGWVWDDLGICYAAPVSSFIIDKNCIHGRLTPKLASINGKLTLSGTKPVKVSSTAYFDKAMATPFCSLSLKQRGKNQFHLSGCHPGSRSVRLAIAINDPRQFTIDTIKQITRSLNIPTTRGIVAGKQPLNANIAVEHLSPPVSELVSEMLLASDNLIADSLLKLLGRTVYNETGSFANGSAALHKVLAKEGIVLDNSQLVDGSGLSRYNLISAMHLVNALRLIQTDARFTNIQSSLPTAGQTGTLTYKRGFKHPHINGRIMAKTGSMQGVSNLAGFIVNKQTKKPEYLFVIVENGIAPSTEKKASSAAKILQALVNKKGEVWFNQTSP